MIIKKRDPKQSDIDALTALLALPLPENKRLLIERELRFVKSGDRGENDASYFIDFSYGNLKNWAIIHDLRLEHEGRVAQIDHLLISRFFDIYVIETKSYAYGVKITDTGEFLVSTNNKYFAIESPIEQNNRHISVLEKIIDAEEIMPRRMGILISPRFHSRVLVSPKSRVIRPSKTSFDTGMVIKADELKTAIDRDIDGMSHISVLASASKVVSTETLESVAHQIARLHRPIQTDWIARFGIEQKASLPEPIPKSSPGKEKSYFCSKCRKTITPKVASFCFDNKKRFGGRAFCFDCQKAIST